MAFNIKEIVPWGRNLDEYKNMFKLTDSDLDKRIICFGDGPASFNYEMKSRNPIVSIDPIYKFSSEEIRDRIEEIKATILEQVKKNKDNYVWQNIKDVDDLEKIRITAMNNFLKDYEHGKVENRYITHELPKKLDFADSSFDLGLSSHFLILYSHLGLDFHISSIIEMLRVAKEARIFPIVNLNGDKTELLNSLIEYFQVKFKVSVEKTNYEFQKNGNEMLIIKRAD